MLEYFKKIPTLTTERLILRRVSKCDTDDMYEYSADDRVCRYLLWSAHASRDQTRRYIRSLQKYYRKGSFFDWAVVHAQSGKMIGTCGFSRIDPTNRCAELGYVLNADYWGQGIAAEAARAVLRVGFCELDLNRIEARYMTENTASAAVMQKLGMQYEGIKRGELFVKGSFRDIGYYSILQDAYLRQEEYNGSSDR